MQGCSGSTWQLRRQQSGKPPAKKATAKAKRPAVRAAGPATTIRLIEQASPCAGEYEAFLKAVGGHPVDVDGYPAITWAARKWPKAKVKVDDPILLTDIAKLKLAKRSAYSMTPEDWVEWIVSHGALVGGAATQVERLLELESNDALATRVLLRCDEATINSLLQ